MPNFDSYSKHRLRLWRIVLVDVYPSKAKLALYHAGHCYLFASTVSAYSLWQMLRRVMEDGSTRSLRNAVYDCGSLRFDIAIHGIWAKTNPNMRPRFHVSWRNSEVLMSLAASLEHFFYHFSQYGFTWMSNMNFLCELTIVIPDFLASSEWPKLFHRPSN